MCRLCYIAETDFSVPPIMSKFNKDRFLNAKSLEIKKGENVMDGISENGGLNIYEQLSLHTYVMKCLAEHRDGDRIEKDPSSDSEQSQIASGVTQEWQEFESALQFLSRHNPTRFKTIEHLEQNYRISLSQAKQQRASALSSLQTRQSLEMDMLTAQSNYAKSDIEALVQQHCAEVDALVDHWAETIRGIQQRQLVEYRDLVMEVVQSELSGREQIFRNNFHELRQYFRPEIPGLNYLFMRPVCVNKFREHRVRLIRVSHMEGDFLSSLVVPRVPEMDQSVLDPEEQCASNDVMDEVISAIILGCSSPRFEFKSNQDQELLRKIDTESPSDCRWPCLLEQVELLRSLRESPIRKTRHSNLGNGISVIYHIDFARIDSEKIQAVFKDCELSGVRRVFIPDVLVPDLRAPSVQTQGGVDVASLAIPALKQLSNVYHGPSVDEVVIIQPRS